MLFADHADVKFRQVDHGTEAVVTTSRSTRGDIAIAGPVAAIALGGHAIALCAGIARLARKHLQRHLTACIADHPGMAGRRADIGIGGIDIGAPDRTGIIRVCRVRWAGAGKHAVCPGMAGGCAALANIHGFGINHWQGQLPLRKCRTGTGNH